MLDWFNWANESMICLVLPAKTNLSRRRSGMEPAVTTVLARALGPSRVYSVGRVWKLA